VILAAALGALAGSRLLAAIADVPAFPGGWRRPAFWVHGKTIVGGLLGGWIGVELAKRRAGIRARTGDLFAAPLAVGIAIGRIGCFLSGPADHTAGRPTSLPWGIAMGDGVRRQPVALYEIAFLLLLLPVLLRPGRIGPPGSAFRIFVAGYLLFRLAVDFAKPDPPMLAGGLTALQWACVAGIGAVARGELRGKTRPALAVQR
jgi:prolipoprotein diacylglyceryltransferase